MFKYDMCFLILFYMYKTLYCRTLFMKKYGFDKMDFKKGIIFLVLTVLLFSIASASAADMNETATTSTDEYESELSQIDEQEVTGQNENSELSQIDEQEVASQNENSEVKSGNPGTFTELQMSIDENYGKTLILNKSYEYEEGFSIEGIEITGSITIDGQGCTIDAQGKARIFIVKSENVILKT